MSMLKPKSKLPWICRTINTPEKFKGQIEVFNEENEFICTGSLTEGSNINVKYIVQACNNFPEAVKLLEEAKSFKRIADYEKWIKKVEEFLKSLEENGK